jgi:hypothetical protein
MGLHSVEKFRSHLISRERPPADKTRTASGAALPAVLNCFQCSHTRAIIRLFRYGIVAGVAFVSEVTAEVVAFCHVIVVGPSAQVVAGTVAGQLAGDK